MKQIDIETPNGSRNHVIVPDTVKTMFNLDNESTNKTRSVVNNVGRALGMKKGLMFGSKNIGTINNSDIYDSTRIYILAKNNLKRSCFKTYSRPMV